MECLSYLINWNWKGLLEEATSNAHSDVLARRQQEYESFPADGLKTGFDLEIAPDELLDPDPRLCWLRRAILKQPKKPMMPILDEEQQQQQQPQKGNHHRMLKNTSFFLWNTRPLLSTQKEMFFPKEARFLLVPATRYAIFEIVALTILQGHSHLKAPVPFIAAAACLICICYNRIESTFTGTCSLRFREESYCISHCVEKIKNGNKCCKIKRADRLRITSALTDSMSFSWLSTLNSNLRIATEMLPGMKSTLD